MYFHARYNESSTLFVGPDIRVLLKYSIPYVYCGADCPIALSQVYVCGLLPRVSILILESSL